MYFCIYTTNLLINCSFIEVHMMSRSYVHSLRVVVRFMLSQLQHFCERDTINLPSQSESLLKAILSMIVNLLSP